MKRLVLAVLSFLAVACGDREPVGSAHVEIKDPEWGPGSEILFYQRPGGDYEAGIWIIDVTTLDRQFVASGRFATWGPSSDLVAISAGSSLQVLRRGDDGVWNFDSTIDLGENVITYADWSPDGSSILLDILGPIELAGLSVIDATTGEIREISPRGVAWRTPVWSPDGRSIAYSVNNGSGQAALWVIDVESLDQRQVTDPSGRDLFPRWHPDGRSLAFSRKGVGIVEVDVVTRSVRVLVRDRPLDYWMVPTWSSSGSAMAFNEDRLYIIEDGRKRLLN